MDADVNWYVLFPYFVWCFLLSLRRYYAHSTEVSNVPKVKSWKWQRQEQFQWTLPPHYAGLTPLESQAVKCSQRKHGLVGKLRSAGVRYKDCKCPLNKRHLRYTLIGDAEMRD